jgi:hypothetical protein
VLRLHDALKIEQIQVEGWMLRHHKGENGAVFAEAIEFMTKPSFST